MTTERSLTLIKGATCNIKEREGGRAAEGVAGPALAHHNVVAQVGYEHVKLGPQTNGNAKTLVKFIDDHVAQQDTENRYNFLAIQARICNPEVIQFRVGLHLHFVVNLRQLLPDPFILIQLKLGASEPIVEEKRFRLGDMPSYETTKDDIHHKHFSIHNDSLVFTDLQIPCTIGVTVGWLEPIHETRLPSQTFMQRLFDDEPGWPVKDLTIVAGNGAEIKCHRMVFACQSHVLSAMLSSNAGWEEARTGRIEMRENSEVGLRLLVQLMYGRELILNDVSCDVLLELFQTAHKYDMGQLEKSLVEFFLTKDGHAFSTGELFELYLYVKNSDAEDMIKLRDHSLDQFAWRKDIFSCEEMTKLGEVESSALIDILFRILQRK